MDFFGRETELKDIKEKLRSDQFEAILVYGRRRVGKSELLKEAIKQSGLESIMYICLQDILSENVKNLSAAATAFFHDEDFVQLNNLETFLKYVFKKSERQKFVLFIDEYPYLRGTTKRKGQTESERENLKERGRAIDSRFQAAIDTYKSNSKLKLILCGSLIEVMEDLIDDDAPLYGRFTYTKRLEPFDYYESAQFFPGISNEKKLEFYACFGGIPFYLALLDPKKSLKENMERYLIPLGSVLESEVTVQLRQEMDKLEGANYILGSIARGIHANNDLRNTPGSKSKSLESYLEKLASIGLIEKTAPINEPTNRKKFFFYISDNFLDFYYSFLYKRQSERLNLSPDEFFDKFIGGERFKTYIARKFEDVAKEYLRRLNRAKLLKPSFNTIGRYVYNDKNARRNNEFDVVTSDENGMAYYECKYGKSKLSAKEIQTEIASVQEIGINFYKYGFFSKSGFKGDVDSKRYALYSMDDLYKQID